MSARTRVAAVVAALSATAAVVAVGAAVLQSRTAGDDERAPARRAGAPPLSVELGLRRDAEARELRRAAALLRAGRRHEAALAFERLRSLEARVGLAVAHWPEGTVETLRRLAREHPGAGVVRLNLALALLWAGRDGEAAAALRATLRTDPDSPYAIRADDFLHLNSPQGLPELLPTASPPAALTRLSPQRQVAALRARAAGARGSPAERARWKLLYGVALQRLGRPLSAQRQFTAAAQLAPSDLEARVADAVGRFRKSDPAPAFSRLGPLTRRYGRSPLVRFHLALLLLWRGDVEPARDQLELARAAGPETKHGRAAAAFLRELNRPR